MYTNFSSDYVLILVELSPFPLTSFDWFLSSGGGVTLFAL